MCIHKVTEYLKFREKLQSYRPYGADEVVSFGRGQQGGKTMRRRAGSWELVSSMDMAGQTRLDSVREGVTGVQALELHTVDGGIGDWVRTFFPFPLIPLAGPAAPDAPHRAG